MLVRRSLIADKRDRLVDVRGGVAAIIVIVTGCQAEKGTEQQHVVAGILHTVNGVGRFLKRKEVRMLFVIHTPKSNVYLLV